MFRRDRIKRPPPLVADRLSDRLLLMALALVLLPHLGHLPLWIPLLTWGLIGLRIWLERQHRKLHPWALNALALAALAGVLIDLHTIVGLTGGLSLLALMIGLKLLEARGDRDRYLLLFLAYFLVVTNFLYSQEIWVALFMALTVILITWCWVQPQLALNRRSGGQALRLSVRLLLQGLPLMLVLWMLFPRLSGPLWGLPDEARARSGLSDQMRPGAIGELALSDEIAFRVRFDDNAPPPSARYWRGLVLYFTDGKQWRAGFSRPGTAGPERVSREGREVAYSLMLEPHGKKWLFALDLPDTRVHFGQLDRDLQWRARRPIDSTLHYRHRSYPAARQLQIDADQRRRALQLPHRIDDRVRQLAANWAEGRSESAIIAEALTYFREQPFVYTLRPPVMARDPVAEFLFEQRRGFCEHYASAFTTLMRLAGIPTRIVLGYQGGESSELGNYLIVRQADAHAWAESWIEGRGWVRIDPTAAVAPERIELPIFNGPGNLGEEVRFGRGNGSLWQGYLEQLSLWGDWIDYSWTRWVLAYGPDSQQALLRWLGLAGNHLGTLVGMMLGLSGLSVLAVLLWQIRRPRQCSPTERLYRRFLNKMERRGLVKQPDEGEWAFAERVLSQAPQLAPQIRAFTQIYLAQRYQAQPPAEALRQLRQGLRGL